MAGAVDRYMPQSLVSGAVGLYPNAPVEIQLGGVRGDGDVAETQDMQFHLVRREFDC